MERPPSRQYRRIRARQPAWLAPAVFVLRCLKASHSYRFWCPRRSFWRIGSRDRSGRPAVLTPFLAPSPVPLSATGCHMSWAAATRTRSRRLAAQQAAGIVRPWRSLLPTNTALPLIISRTFCGPLRAVFPLICGISAMHRRVPPDERCLRHRLGRRLSRRRGRRRADHDLQFSRSSDYPREFPVNQEP